MINGRVSTILYSGAWLAIFMLISVVGVLSYNSKPIPDDLSYALISLVSFIVGTHVSPPGEHSK